LIVVRAERGSQVCSSGETERADTFWIDAPFCCVLADEAEGALRILQGSGGFGVGAGAGHAVFEQNAVDAGGIEPVADLGAFKIDGQNVVTAAGKDHDGRAGAVAGCLVEGEGGCETLPRRTSGLPAMRLSLAVVVSASAGGLAGAPGATPGHTGRVRWLGAGGHPDCWANSAG